MTAIDGGTPFTDETAEKFEPIEFAPNLLDRAAGLAGRVLTDKAGATDYRAPEGYSINSMLDEYERSEYRPTLELWAENNDDIFEAAKPLLGLIMQSPRLESPIFLPGIRRADRRMVCTIRAHHYDWASLPVRNFVIAPDLEDWNRGRGYRESRNKIRSFAARTKPLPPIDSVSANIQPNGVVLFDVIKDGAHRVAAAHLRGDEEINVDGPIFVNRLSTDLVPLPNRR